MVARTRGWIKIQDLKPNEQTWESSPYDVEIRQPVPDQKEEEKQLKHAEEQLGLTRQYPGRNASN